MDEWHAAKEKLQWSHERMGEVIGVTERTPYRYASGDVEIPEPAARLMRSIVWARSKLKPPQFERFVRVITTAK